MLNRIWKRTVWLTAIAALNLTVVMGAAAEVAISGGVLADNKTAPYRDITGQVQGIASSGFVEFSAPECPIESQEILVFVFGQGDIRLEWKEGHQRVGVTVPLAEVQNPTRIQLNEDVNQFFVKLVSPNLFIDEVGSSQGSSNTAPRYAVDGVPNRIYYTEVQREEVATQCLPLPSDPDPDPNPRVTGGGLDITVTPPYDSYLMRRDGQDFVMVTEGDCADQFPVDNVTSQRECRLRYGRTYDIPFHANVDHDERLDLTVFRPPTREWHSYPTGGVCPQGLAPLVHYNGRISCRGFVGNGNDHVVMADFDGDGLDDPTNVDPNTFVWTMLPSAGLCPQSWTTHSRSPGIECRIQLGLPGDQVAPADFDGDHYADVAVWRADGGNWFTKPSSGRCLQPFENSVILDGAQSCIRQWGLSNQNDLAKPGDYDGDGRDDLMIVRQADWNWHLVPSTGICPRSFQYVGRYLGDTWCVQKWGRAGDQPLPGDFNNDGATDLGLWRPGAGTWHVLSTSPCPGIFRSLGSYGGGNNCYVRWGESSDTPLR